MSLKVDLKNIYYPAHHSSLYRMNSLADEKTTRTVLASLDKRPVSRGGGLGISAGYVWTDVSGIPRNVEGFLGNTNPAIGLSGLTNAIMIFTGKSAIESSSKQFEVAHRVDDTWEMVSSGTKFVRGHLELAGGIVQIPSRTFTFASALTSIKAVSVAANVFSAAANGLGAFLYLALFIPGAMSLHQTISFESELNAVKNVHKDNPVLQKSAVATFFKEKVELTEKEKHEIFTKYDDKRIARILKKGQADNIDELRLLTDYDKIAIFKQVFELGKNKTQIEKDKIYQQLRLDFAKAKAKKETHLKTAVGDDGFNAIKAFLNKTGDIDTALKTAEKGLRFNKILGIAGLSICVISFTASILSLPLGGPIALMAIASCLWAASSILWMVVDSTYLFAGLQSQQPGQKDKRLALIMAGIFFVSVALTLAFTGGTAAIILAAKFLIVAIAFSIYTYYKFHHEPKKIASHS